MSFPSVYRCIKGCVQPVDIDIFVPMVLHRGLKFGVAYALDADVKGPTLGGCHRDSGEAGKQHQDDSHDDKWKRDEDQG